MLILSFVAFIGYCKGFVLIRRLSAKFEAVIAFIVLGVVWVFTDYIRFV